MMNRYQSFKTAMITLQAHWRGYKGRCIALDAKKNKSAIIIQKYARRFVKRWIFTCLEAISLHECLICNLIFFCTQQTIQG